MRPAAFITLILCSVPLRADFQYQSTARITGGAMLQMLRFLPGSGKLREPQTSTVAIQGNRMVHRSPDQTQIIDLDKQTITTINAQKRTFAVMTFDQMKEALNNMAASAQNAKQPGSPDMNIDANIQNTGQTRNIGGYDTKESVVTMSMTMTDPRSGQSGSMAMKMDMWLAPEVAGYSEVRDFYRRLAKELDWLPGGVTLMSRPDMARAIAKMMAQGGAVTGTPVEQVMSIRPVVPPGAAADASAPPAQQNSQNTAPQNPSSALAGALAGRLGGLGGFGRKKQASAPQDAPAPADNSLIEMTMDNSGFSSAPVSSDLFQIPAGFHEVPPDLPRNGR